MTTANWIRQATATTGTGTITLGAADTGFVGVGDWFADGDNVHYFIEDSDSGDREEGRGVFASGAGTITRGEILATVTAGTLATYPVSGLTLVGPSTVSINSSAALSLGGGTQFLAGSGSIDLPDNIINYASSTSVTTADRLYLVPAVLLFRRIINEFHIIVTLGAAATDTRIGVWDQQVDGNPGNLLFSSGTIDVTATGKKDVTVSPELVLNPGVYWFGFISDSAVVQGKGNSSHDARTTGGPGGAGVFTQARREIQYIDSPTIPLVSNLTVTSDTDIDDTVGILFS